MSDPEELRALTRNGEVLICHPDMPDETPAAVMPESVGAWVARGWELFEGDVTDRHGHVVTYKDGVIPEVVDVPLDESAEAPRKRTAPPKKTTDTGADAAPKDKE